MLDRVDLVGHLLVLLQELEDALGRGEGGLQDVGDIGRLRDRLRELPGVLDEGLDVAELERLPARP